jgi:hypothetical protein
MVQLPIEPARHDLLHLREIPDHPDRVQLIRLQFDLDLSVVAVKMAAFSVVIHQPVAVAKFDRLGDFIHESLRSVNNDLIILKADDTVNRYDR